MCHTGTVSPDFRYSENLVRCRAAWNSVCTFFARTLAPVITFCFYFKPIRIHSFSFHGAWVPSIFMRLLKSFGRINCEWKFWDDFALQIVRRGIDAAHGHLISHEQQRMIEIPSSTHHSPSNLLPFNVYARCCPQYIWPLRTGTESIEANHMQPRGYPRSSCEEMRWCRRTQNRISMWTRDCGVCLVIGECAPPQLKCRANGHLRFWQFCVLRASDE